MEIGCGEQQLNLISQVSLGRLELGLDCNIRFTERYGSVLRFPYEKPINQQRSVVRPSSVRAIHDYTT